MQLVTEKDLAKYLNVSRWTASRWYQSGKLIPEVILNEDKKNGQVRLYDKLRWKNMVVDNLKK